MQAQVKKQIQAQIIPFKKVRNEDLFYSETNMKHLQEVIKRIENREVELKEHKIIGVDE